MNEAKNIFKNKSMKLNTIFLLLLVIFVFQTSENLFASGGFGGGVSQIPKGADREKYHIGKAIYNKEIDFAEVDATKEKEQIDRLENLQSALPNPEKKRVNLPELSGRLTTEQLNALEYFITVRFNIKLDKK